jgi:hypothetical protein
MAPFAWVRLKEPHFGFFETLMGSLFLLTPAALTVGAFWRWQRDAYKHVITPWRWRVLVLGLYLNLLALTIFWTGITIPLVHEPQWTPRLLRIIVWWRNSDIAVAFLAFICSLFGDGDGRYALALATLWFLFLLINATAPVFL